MAKLNAKTLAAVTLAAVTLTAPAIAHANNYSNSNYRYEDCKRVDSENQLVGGLIGAVAGGVLGSQVASRGTRTEGSALGAVLGAGIGAAIGDDKRKCRTESGRIVSYDRAPQTYNSGYSGRNVYTSPRIQTVHHTTDYQNRSYGNRDYGQSRGYEYNDAGYSYDRLNRINRKIERLRSERRELKNRRSYRYDPYVDRRLYEISCDLDELKKRKKRIKKQARRTKRHYRNW